MLILFIHEGAIGEFIFPGTHNPKSMLPHTIILYNLIV